MAWAEAVGGGGEDPAFPGANSPASTKDYASIAPLPERGKEREIPWVAVSKRAPLDEIA
jgi:hypothetical protein